MRRAVRRIRRLVLRERSASELALRRRITDAGGSLRPAPPGDRWRGWANSALLDEAQVDAAVGEVRRVGLVPHQDRPKNWDLLVALGEILSRTGRSARVLEMGAASYSPLLVWLYQYGYRRLHGIDLTYAEPIRRGPITFEGMNLEHTRFEDHSFDAIACLSVIEHGVNVDAYLAEARRLLRPGGILVTSTDYWSEPIDTAGLEAYGGPVRIFAPDDIRRLLDTARGLGFHTTGEVRLACRDRVVRWERMGLDYTFLALSLVAPGRPRPAWLPSPGSGR